MIDIEQIELRYANYKSSNFQMNRAVADIQDLLAIINVNSKNVRGGRKMNWHKCTKMPEGSIIEKIQPFNPVAPKEWAYCGNGLVTLRELVFCPFCGERLDPVQGGINVEEYNSSLLIGCMGGKV